MRRITLACLLVCLAIGGLVSPAQAQDSCAELNAFWDDKVYLITEDKISDPHPTSKDFAVFDTSVYKWPLTLSCPSIHSAFASALKLLSDFSHSAEADLNYYEWARKIMLEAEYVFMFEKKPGFFASTDHDARTISLVPSSFSYLSEVAIAATIVHEVRHIEKDFGHVVCDHGQNKGKRSCDEMFVQDFIDSPNTYSAEILFLHDVAQSGGSQALIDDAKRRISTLLDNQINTLPEFGPDGVTPLRAYYGVE